MDRLTRFSIRKIVYLILLLAEVGTIIGATLAVNPTYNVFLWKMFFMSNTIGVDASIGAYIIGCLSCVMICVLLLSIPFILRKRDVSYLNALGSICVLLTICLIMNIICKPLGTLSTVLLVISLVINVISSIYCFLCIKFNYEDTDLIDENKEEKEESENGQN